MRKLFHILFQSTPHKLNLLVILLLVVTLPLIIITTQKPQDDRQHASVNVGTVACGVNGVGRCFTNSCADPYGIPAGGSAGSGICGQSLGSTGVCCYPSNNSGGSCQTLPVKVPVVVAGYFPPDPNNPNAIDPKETGWTPQLIALYSGRQNMTLQDWQNNVKQMAYNMSQVISNATAYHGYKDVTAMPFLNYRVIDTKFFNKPIPHSTYVVNSANGTLRPDYNKAMQDLGNVCNYVDGQGVKEIWLYSYHNEGLISPDESRMSSNYGDVSNSYPHDPGFPLQFRLPKCNNSYVMYNFEMWPDPNFIDNTIHNRMHEIENTMSFATDTYQITTAFNPPFTPSINLFYGIGHFADPYFALGNNTKHTTPGTCGNTHFVPNWLTENDLYNYNLKSTYSSNCADWNPDATKSTYAPVSCQAWGCTTLGYYQWWMQNLPGYNNQITYQNQQMRNWWEAMYDFNTFINQKRSLLGNSIFSCITPPTPIDPTDQALNKPATSNRTDEVPGHEPAKAVDGDTTSSNNSWQVNNPIHTGDWWQIDLGTNMSIGKIIIYPHAQNTNDWCSLFHAEVSPTGQFTGEQTKVINQMYPYNVALKELIYTFASTPGRYVRITCDVTQNYIQLQEVQVYAYTGPPPQPSITITPNITMTPSPTPSTNPSGTTFSATLCPHGLGKCGDNANPSGSGNTTPKHTTKTATLTLLDNNNQPVATVQAPLSFDTSQGNYQGSFSISTIPAGQYIASIKIDAYLLKQLPGIITVIPGQSIALPSTDLVTGDINNDNQLDILDYNLLISCFGSKQTSPSCSTPPTQQSAGSDITDDGTVDGADYNLFLRELSIQKGA